MNDDDDDDDDDSSQWFTSSLYSIIALHIITVENMIIIDIMVVMFYS